MATVLGTAAFSRELTPESEEDVTLSPKSRRKKAIHNKTEKKARELLRNATMENPDLSFRLKRDIHFLPENEAIPVEAADAMVKVYRTYQKYHPEDEAYTLATRPQEIENRERNKYREIAIIRKNAKILEPIREMWPHYYEEFLTYDPRENMELLDDPNIEALLRVENIASHYASNPPSRFYERQGKNA